MFEKEIKFIGDFCSNQLRSLGTNFTIEKIINVGIHPAIIQYISAELEFMIYSDRRKLLQQSYFDYTGQEISEYLRKISNEIKKQKKISIEDSKKLIFQAVSFNINYLVRPRWSLTKLIFNDQPVISVEEIRLMLNYLYYYDYFKHVLNGYISKRNLLQISASEFELVLDKIDKELLNSNQEQLIYNSFTSMGDFFNIGGMDKNIIPITAVEIFLKEKNLLELVLKLQKALSNGVKKQYDKNEIVKVLFSPAVAAKTVEEIADEKEPIAEEKEEQVEKIESESFNKSFEKSPADSGRTSLESFLTPEEEEALLSLYNEESVQQVISSNDQKTAGEPETIISDNLEVKQTEPVSIPSEEIQEKIIETPEEKLDEELEDIVESITTDLPEQESAALETFSAESTESITDAIENQPEYIDSDLFKAGIEKEIVQEMIKDFYGENFPSASTQEESDQQLEETSLPVSEPIAEQDEDKIESIENDLLNIFENLDKEDLKSDKSLSNVKEIISTEKGGGAGDDRSLGFSKDGFDDYLKSIDEAVFKQKQETVLEDRKKIEVKDSPIPTQQKVEVQEGTAVQKNKIEKVVSKTRNIRPKDFFSYLRKKESKKIVFYIFANDEEDFTNTAERIMDCHSYKEASEILKAVFTSYKISPYSKEAITFTNAVSNYFRQA